MGGKDLNYTVVYRGDFIESVPEGRWMMIQRGKEYGGGYWFGKAYADCFWLEFERPMSLADCVEYVVRYDQISAGEQEFEEEFKLV
ncbi:TPA: lF-82 [Raoultella ornithinolytica]